MAMSDPIADMLTRLRNAITAGQAMVDMPTSKLKEQICALLKREGFIRDYMVSHVEGHPRGLLRVTLKYMPDRTPVVKGLRRISKPSLRVYKQSKELRPVRSGLGIAVVSTSQGVMTGKQARAAHMGGEVLCEVW